MSYTALVWYSDTVPVKAVYEIKCKPRNEQHLTSIAEALVVKISSTYSHPYLSGRYALT